MYIPEFAVGVFATLAVEAVLFFTFLIITMVKQSNERKGEDDSDNDKNY